MDELANIEHRSAALILMNERWEYFDDRYFSPSDLEPDSLYLKGVIALSRGYYRVRTKEGLDSVKDRVGRLDMPEAAVAVEEFSIQRGVCVGEVHRYSICGVELNVPVLSYRHPYRNDYGITVRADVVKAFLPLRSAELAKSIVREAWSLHVMPYADYLNTEHWSWTVENYRKDRCELCGRAWGMNLHHNTYVRRGFEDRTDFITLCRPCHKRFHALAGTLS